MIKIRQNDISLLLINNSLVNFVHNISFSKLFDKLHRKSCIRKFNLLFVGNFLILLLVTFVVLLIFLLEMLEKN